jgi:pimeloyl-ACP methyl ester carboxylesterase
LLIFHDEIGDRTWLDYHQQLAQDYNLILPSHSGFGATQRREWIVSMRDLAGWYLELMDDLGLGQVNAIGFSMGGWLAAEIASMCPQVFKKLALVGPMGIRPPTGEIYDMFLVVAKQVIADGFLNPDSVPEFATLCPDEPTPEQIDIWEDARVEASRLGWRPYMHNPSLPNLLHRVKSLPTLLIWGQQDGIVPVSAGQVYQESIKDSRLAVVENCGHRVEVEKSGEFVRLVKEFLSA